MLKPENSSPGSYASKAQSVHPTPISLSVAREPKASSSKSAVTQDGLYRMHVHLFIEAEMMIEMQEAHELQFHGNVALQAEDDGTPAPAAFASSSSMPNTRPTTGPASSQHHVDMADIARRPASTGPLPSLARVENEKGSTDTKSHPSGSPTELSFLPSDFSSAQPFRYPTASEQTFDTLDERVGVTLQRDLHAIWTKLKLVLRPKIQQTNTLRDWDLWGPLVLCLALAVCLSIASNAQESAAVFTLIFVVVWCGSAVVTINSKLLGGQISFFQSVCVLGYCIFPLVIGSLIALVVSSHLVRMLIIVPLLGWSVYAALGFLAESTSEKKRLLNVYPVFLFYFVISWVIVIC